MVGYANRFIYIGFPQLTEPDDHEIHVRIKNPKLLPLDQLQPTDIHGDDGLPDEAKARLGMFRVIAGLIQTARVYDATSMEEDQRPMDLPLSPEDVARLPWEIVKAITDKIGEAVNPA